MEYRINKNNGDKISLIGMGSGAVCMHGKTEGAELLRTAYENGINYFDMATSVAEVFEVFGEALSDVRKQIKYQIHFGAVYDTGEYGWSLNTDQIKKSVDWQLETMKTDYIDYGFIHCLDELHDWEEYQRNGVLELILDYKRQGIVKNVGASSHTPSIAEKIMDTVPISMLMFSINPAYDYHKGSFANGSVDERNRLYKRCEKEKIGISVMKPYAGGQLLDERQSVFRMALTPIQCLQYALDKPGVITVLPGAGSTEELKDVLGLLSATKQEKDYSSISAVTPEDAMGKCVYCNHCAPCPAGINIGLVNKYYDLMMTGDMMAVSHYKNLEKHAADCISCKHCDKRCPFQVNQCERMKEIASQFESLNL